MKKLRKIAFLSVILLAFMALTIVIAIYAQNKLHPKDEITTITREGVVTEIQRLNQLHSAGFSVDAIITAQKDGTWYKLWQDSQKGLFVANGRVLAGIDLSKMTADKVTVSYPAPNTPVIEIELPAPEIFEVYLDNIQVYDWQTGLFGIFENDPAILTQVQQQGKDEVLKKACQGNILAIANDNANAQLKTLFALTGATVKVTNSQNGQCSLAR